MSGSLITGRSREEERDRCRSSTSPPDQSAGTRPQGPARRPSGRSFRRGIEDATVRGLVNGAQPSDPFGGHRRASNAAKRAQRLQSGRSVANMATDPARASSRSSERRPERRTAPRSARGHRRTHPSGKTRRRGPKRRTAPHTETDTESADVLRGLQRVITGQRAAPAALAFRIAGSQSSELQADSCAASRRRRTPSGGTPAERHTITAERGRPLKERRGASRERRGTASERRRVTRERRGAATERCSEIREQLGESPEGRRPPSCSSSTASRSEGRPRRSSPL